MDIKITDIGSEIRGKLKSSMKVAIRGVLGKLPSSDDYDLIVEAITDDTKSNLDSMIVKYYKDDLGVDIGTAISKEDYALMYLNRI